MVVGWPGKPRFNPRPRVCAVIQSPPPSVPRACEPQQRTAPSGFTPQVWSYPALTEANSPAGGVAWPHARPGANGLPIRSAGETSTASAFCLSTPGCAAR